MKKKRTTRRTMSAMGVGGLLVAGLATLASAADYPQRQDLAVRSRRDGLGKTEVQLYTRRAGPGRAALAKTLLGRFAAATGGITTGGPVTYLDEKDHVHATGQGWSLKVWADGTKVSYRNIAYLDGKGVPVPVEQRLSEDQLLALGQRFLRGALGDLLPLGPGEELVPFYTEFQVEGGGPAEEGGRRMPEQVMANTVVFARSVEGSVIVGAGSKAVVTFSNDGTPVAFDFDWPQYDATGRFQKVLALDAIRSRMLKLASIPLDSPSVQIQRFECGYFDAGARKHDPAAPIQAACFVQAKSRNIVDRDVNAKDPASGHVVSAYADPIPAGATVAADRTWPQVLRLLGQPVPLAPRADDRPPAN